MWNSGHKADLQDRPLLETTEILSPDTQNFGLKDQTIWNPQPANSIAIGKSKSIENISGGETPIMKEPDRDITRQDSQQYSQQYKKSQFYMLSMNSKAKAYSEAQKNSPDKSLHSPIDQQSDISSSGYSHLNDTSGYGKKDSLLNEKSNPGSSRPSHYMPQNETFSDEDSFRGIFGDHRNEEHDRMVATAK